MQEENLCNALVVLSSTEDEEFRVWECIAAELNQLLVSLDTMSEKKDLHNNEYKKVMETYEETLLKLESRKKSLQRVISEYKIKIADTEGHLEKSRARLMQIREQLSQLMRRKESLMIFLENNELEDGLEALSNEAEFFGLVSCIRWATDKEPHEIQGFQGLIEPHRSQPFAFDKREKSSFFICNKLWEMMEPAEDWSDLAVKPTNYCADKNIALTYSVDVGQLDEPVAI